MKLVHCTQLNKIKRRLKTLYGTASNERLFERFYSTVGRYEVGYQPLPKARRWNHTDTVLITYADSIVDRGERPLVTLNRFCSEYLQGLIRTVHILPFFPWSSDDGFSIIDYRRVNPPLGTWQDIEALGANFGLMFDLVLNHCSRESTWYRDFLIGIDPARKYFIEVSPDEDLSSVVRPRTSPLLTKATTRYGDSHLWTTFSEDQLDLNWKNPDVLFEFIDILFRYIHHGAKIIRLDAITYLWKELGTSCVHLPQTHEVVKLLRNIIDTVAPDVWLITETNVPHEENIAYFDKGHEAHMVYNFALPPLILHTLLSGNAKKLTQWAQELSTPPRGCTYFNFSASHDGVGLRPVETILSAKEQGALVKAVEKRGGLISHKTNTDGSKSPYELNISYVSALSEEDDEDLGIQRFLCSQAIVLGFKGIPAVYIHSLIGTENDLESVSASEVPRRINRHKWESADLELTLQNSKSAQARIFKAYRTMLKRRSEHPAFDPDGEQIVHNPSPELFVTERVSPDKGERILCIYNCTDRKQTLSLETLDTPLKNAKSLKNALSGKLKKPTKSGLSLAPYEALWLLPNGP